MWDLACLLLADAKTRENPSQQVIGTEGSGDFPKHLLCLPQVLCQ